MALPQNAENDLRAASLDVANVDLEKLHNSSPSELTIDPGFLDWNGPDDLRNPKNWPKKYRIYISFVTALYGFLITVSTSVIVPAIPYIAVEFGVGREVAILSLSAYTLGVALGPLVAAPISEVVGRRSVYWVTLFFLVSFTIGSAVATNIQTLIICRFLAGFLGSGGVAIGAGSIADVWDMAKDGGPASVVFVLSAFLGPSFGPLIGAYIIAEYNDRWRFSMWVILCIAAPIAVLSLFMRETFKDTILNKNSAKGTNVAAKLRKKLFASISRSIKMLLTEPLVAAISTYTGFAFGLLFAFFGSFPYVLTIKYGFNPKQNGLAFLAFLIGFILAVIVFVALDKTLYAKARAQVNGHPAPEYRLYGALVGSILLPIGLFWYAWGAYSSHWIVTVLPGIPFAMGLLLIFLSGATYLVDVYQSAAAASALAANGLLRYSFGAAFPLFVFQMYENVGIGWSGSIFGFVSLLFLPIPWLFFYGYGEKLRARSAYDTWKPKVAT